MQKVSIWKYENFLPFANVKLLCRLMGQIQAKPICRLVSYQLAGLSYKSFKYFRLNFTSQMANFDFCHNRINDISPINSPHMSKSNDLLMYHESLMSNDHLMSTQGGLMMPELVPIVTGKSLSEAFILTSTLWQKIVHWLTSSVHENYKLRTCCVNKLFWMSKQKQTLYVHNMFWACNFLLLNW